MGGTAGHVGHYRACGPLQGNVGATMVHVGHYSACGPQQGMWGPQQGMWATAGHVGATAGHVGHSRACGGHYRQPNTYRKVKLCTSIHILYISVFMSTFTASQVHVHSQPYYTAPTHIHSPAIVTSQTMLVQYWLRNHSHTPYESTPAHCTLLYANRMFFQIMMLIK